MTMELDQVLWQLASAFDEKLVRTKAENGSVQWYPYRSMANIQHLTQILPETIKSRLSAGDLDLRVLDVGAADGDLGYFFESRGASVDFLDNPPTNYNDCKGLLAIRDALGSPSRLITQDIDREIKLEGEYDFAIALGLLYHLRNPMLFLMELARHAQTMVLSTRVVNRLPDGTAIGSSSVAYLLRRRESNDDPTNYWCFSPVGLDTVLSRSGWKILATTSIGADEQSDPVTPENDRRDFVYCERVANWRDLGAHHDF